MFGGSRSFQLTQSEGSKKAFAAPKAPAKAGAFFVLGAIPMVADTGCLSRTPKVVPFLRISMLLHPRGAPKMVVFVRDGNAFALSVASVADGTKQPLSDGAAQKGFLVQRGMRSFADGQPTV